ncbi:hypothetical protein N7462_001064 [Penicillium macrosclerotiorum]|uniref:uncharacterized protein n=1 Tax=Penicillium macrosclerotiorum TaxID=303699 RepID=UPI0025470A54|nr:uncharacterized protein N7462_001064 [Penicillium macrosclerotiorum]KAJ5699059.1 hypothetical protein N7462_001064 [Penicillium macrosclerotiorum]
MSADVKIRWYDMETLLDVASRRDFSLDGLARDQRMSVSRAGEDEAIMYIFRLFWDGCYTLESGSQYSSATRERQTPKTHTLHVDRSPKFPAQRLEG